jgi:ankyrin repeat protein
MVAVYRDNWFDLASFRLETDYVATDLGYTLLGEAHRRLLEDDVEGLETIVITEDGPEKMGIMLVFACVHGARRCAKYLVEQGAVRDVDMAVFDGQLNVLTPLTVAALLGHWEVVEVLVEGGAEAHAVDTIGFSALLIAARRHPQGSLEYLLRLEDIRRHINSGNFHGITPVMVASASAVPLLVEAGADVNLESKSGSLAVSRACYSGCLDRVKALVECGADELHAESDGRSPLMFAAEEGHLHIVEYLLDRPGINLEAKTDKGLRPINFASESGHLEVVKRLVAAGAKIEPQASDETGALASAAMGGSVPMVKYLVEEAGADERRADSDGVTPLIAAVKNGRADVVAYLLGRPGADIEEAQTKQGITALDFAVNSGHLEVVKVLVAAGARLEPRAGEELGALASAITGGFLKVVKYLVEEAGADVTHVGPRGNTYLMGAAIDGRADILAYLLGRPGVSINARRASGETAIDLACRKGHLEVVKLLVAAGADITPNSNQWGTLADAVAGGKLDVVKYLLEEAGAGERRLNPDAITLLVFAARCSDAKIAAYLQQAALRRKEEVSMPLCACKHTSIMTMK